MTVQAASLRELVGRASARLAAAGCDGAQAEAEWLVAEAAGGLRRTELYLQERPAPPEISHLINQWLARRLAGEPLQHITGSAEFCGHRLEVSADVLIPRPETEVIVEEAIRRLRRLAEAGRKPLRVLDLGTGSGNIAIALALAVPACAVVAVELSWVALRMARNNVARHGLQPRVRLLQADWTGGVVAGRFDVIVSNPPYVSSGEMDRLPDVVRREPPAALDGGADGLDAFRRLLARIPDWRSPGGIVGFECAETHQEALSALCGAQPWVKRMDAVRDLAGRPRGVFLETE